MKACVYKITSPNSNQCYIGQTTKKYLPQRFFEHVSNYKRFYTQNKGNYRSSYEIIEQGDAKIELLEQVEFQTKKELSAHERRWIDKENSVNLVNRSHNKNKIS